MITRASLRCTVGALAILASSASCKRSDAPAPDPMASCGECVLVDELGPERFVRLESTPVTEEGASSPAILHVYGRSGGLCCPQREISLPAGAEVWTADAKASAIYVRSMDARWSAYATFGLSRVDVATGAVSPVVSRMATEYPCDSAGVHRLAAFVRVAPKKEGESFGDSAFDLVVLTLRDGSPSESKRIGTASDFLSIFPDANQADVSVAEMEKDFYWTRDCGAFVWRPSIHGDEHVYDVRTEVDRPSASASASASGSGSLSPTSSTAPSASASTK